MNPIIPWLRRVAALALVVAIVADPDDIGEGFKLLRWLVTVAAAWQLWEIRAEKSNWQRAHQVALATVAILFNPIQPFKFDREWWVWIDGVTAIVLTFGFSSIRNRDACIAAIAVSIAFSASLIGSHLEKERAAQEDRDRDSAWERNEQNRRNERLQKEVDDEERIEKERLRVAVEREEAKKKEEEYRAELRRLYPLLPEERRAIPIEVRRAEPATSPFLGSN